MRKLRKATAFVLAVVMVFSMMVGGDPVQAADANLEGVECTPLVVGQEQTVSITEGGQKAYFSFVPEESGAYIFQSSSAGVSCDTYVTLYKETSNGLETLASDDQGGQNGNFKLTYSYTAGETYILEAKGYSDSFVGNFNVIMIESPIESVVIEPLSIIENTNGYWDSMTPGGEGRFYRYNWWNQMSYVITMTDGQVLRGNGNGFEYNGSRYYLECNDNQYNEHWSVDEKYPGTVSVMGYQTTVDIRIIPSPVKSIEVEPISIMEHTNGSWTSAGPGGGEQFYHYDWYNKMKYVITMKDGQVIRGTGLGFNYNGKWEQFSTTGDEQWNTQWSVGNTYTVTVGFWGCETTVDVSIIDTPAKSVEVEPISISIMEGTNGGFWHMGSEDEFFHYDWINFIEKFTVTMKDGTVYKSKGRSIDYDGESYYLEWEDEQENIHWTAGNTYTAKAKVMGVSTDVKVTITKSPIEKIEVEPITLAEHTYGNWTSSNSGPGGCSPTDPGAWYHYDWYNQLKYTVILKDGRKIIGNNFGCNIDGKYYSMSWSDNQYNSHWYAGNTYSVTISLLGQQVEVPVSVCEKNQTEGYEYLIQNNSAIIIGCSKEDTVLNIPSVIDGYPVIGVTDLTYAMDYAEELVIPDSVTMLSSDIFEWNYALKKLTLGKGVSNIYNEMFIGATCLEEIIVSEENPNYCSVDGVVYDKEMKTLVVFPRAKKGAYTVPDTVTNIDSLINNIFNYDVQLDLGNSKTDYIVEDGVIYNADKTVVYACDKTKTGKYVMPNTVTTINEGAFQECSFSEVVVSENVSEIVYAAFSYSMELEKVVLPKKLKSIGYGAFNECEKLSQADLPSELESLCDDAFRKTGIKKATIPGTVTEVGYGAYRESQVAEVTLEEGIEVIWSHAFADTQLKNVKIPDSITHMGPRVFLNTPLESVTIGKGLEAISHSCFEGTKLKTVTIPENIAEIGSYAFADSTLEEAIIEKKDVYIFEGAFYNCPLKEIDLKDGVVAIDWYAFYGSQAESVVIPDSVTDITYKSFAESNKLAEIDVPDDLESIDGTAFDGTAWWNAQPDGVVYLENYLYGYKGKMPENTEITVKDGTTLVASYAFAHEYMLKKLTIPSSVKSIGLDALYGCLGLEQVSVDAGNTNYRTNDDGTILYDKDNNAVWKKIENVLKIYMAESVRYGASVEDWISASLWEDMGENVRVTYVDGQYGWEQCVITADMVSGFDSTKLGYQTVTIDLGKFTCETEIYIDMPVVESIKINKLPNKTEYDINQSFRPTGMVVSGVTEDGTEFEIQNENLYDIYGFDSSEAGTKTITVVYDDLTATFEVEVTAERITFAADAAPGEETVQVSAPIEAMESGAVLKCDEKPIEDIKESGVVVPEIFEEKSSQIFDIRFEKEENDEVTEVQPAEGTEVMVSIPVPAGMDGRNCKVYHITDGVPVDMKAVFNNGCMEFATTHFSYYGVIEVNGSSISGLVDYANVVDGDVTVTLSKDTVVLDTVTAIDGSYNFTGLENGTYIVKIEKAGHAAREYEVIVGGESVEQDGQIRLIGDTNTDGAVDYGDIQRLYQHLSTDKKLVDYSLIIGDTNEDNNVDYGDIQRLYQHLSTNNKIF